MHRPAAPAVPIARWSDGSWVHAADQVAAEEPLQLLLNGEPLSVLMRTPGSDLELALGLLLAERVITGLNDVARVHLSAESAESESALPVTSDLLELNQVDVRLRGAAGRRPQRSFLSSSACGVCGVTTIESLALDHPVLSVGPPLDAARIPALVDGLRERQHLFAATGGLHAAGLFTTQGELIHLREDIGRHNAVDKVVGRALLEGRLPLSGCLLAVSGRAGYAVVQKAVAAGLPALIAVGAPSSLAVATAQRFGLTLIGFLRGRQFNVYSAPERLIDAMP